jgi:2-succinyl-6-hydroxy-2,4-cyclohexadiene-1-carboxylate synthase
VPEEVVLLHGFSGTHRAWDGVTALLDGERYRAHALDLPGHGARADELPVSFESCTRSVLADAPGRFILCGYSLGGRIAQQVALAAPERVRGMLLISTSAGIEDAGERAARRASDERLARELEEGPFEEFIERWRSQALFAAEPLHARELAIADQRRNDPRALAAVLRGVGAGQMEPMWGRLARLEMPATVLVGDRDERFIAYGRRIASLLGDGRLIAAAGGHGLPLENPAAVVREITALAERLSAPAPRTKA